MEANRFFFKSYEETFFYPGDGATRVVAKDFDQDGDIYLAVSAYFPEYGLAPNESFVYLENVDGEKL